MPVALITGCSSGFGERIAHGLARENYQVYATVRSPTDRDRLETLLGSSANGGVLLLDVTDKAAISAVVEQVIDAAGRIDVLINNAGIARPGAFEDLDEAEAEQVMATNFYGPVWLTRAVLPHMRVRNAGRIVMMSSLSGLIGLPGEAFYAASKAALERAAESLRHEVRRFNIEVSVLVPGAFNTKMPAKLAAAKVPAQSAYRPLLEFLSARSNERQGTGADPELATELVVELLRMAEPPFIVPVGAQAAAVIAKLADLSAAERESFVDDVNDTSWWSEGTERPSS